MMDLFLLFSLMFVIFCLNRNIFYLFLNKIYLFSFFIKNISEKDKSITKSLHTHKEMIKTINLIREINKVKIQI